VFFTPFGEGLRGNVYTVHLRLIGKLVVDFLFVLIELFSGATSEYRLKIGVFAQKFQVQGVVIHQPLFVWEN